MIKSPTTFNFYLYNNSRRSIKFEFGEEFLGWKYYVRVIDQEKMALSLWKNKEIRLFLFDITGEDVKVVKTGHCTFNYNINYCEISQNGCRLLCYSNLNSTLQIWELDWAQEEKVGLTSKNIKAHQAYLTAAAFWNNRYAISCSYDQNVKVWDCDSLPERAPPKGGKNKKKKKKMEVEGEAKEENKAKESSD